MKDGLIECRADKNGITVHHCGDPEIVTIDVFVANSPDDAGVYVPVIIQVCPCEKKILEKRKRRAEELSNEFLEIRIA